MSDVEKICKTNHERRKCAESYEHAASVVAASRKQKIMAQRRHKRLRAAALTCAMITGVAAAFIGMGIACMNMPVMVAAGIAALTFLATGYVFEVMADDAVEEAYSHELR